VAIDSNSKILIIAAHPDDEVLGCGGTAARLAKAGNQVVPVIVCENSTVRYDDVMKTTLRENAIECAEILGIDKPSFLDFPDQRLDIFPALEMAQLIERIIAQHDPQVIFTHHGGDINLDHRVLFDATMVATRPTPTCSVRQVYTYETISATEWGVPGYHQPFTPNVFFDISNTVELKMKGFSKYVSEVKEYPHPRSLEGIEIRAKDWGTRVGMKAAEPFELIRSLQ